MMNMSESINMTLWEKAQSVGIVSILPKPLDTEIGEEIEKAVQSRRAEYRKQEELLPKGQRQDYMGPQRIQSIRNTVIMVISPKGGVGKTTTTVNIACAAALQKKMGIRVAVVDLNEFGTVTIQMNMGSPEKLLDGTGMVRNVLGWEHISEKPFLEAVKDGTPLVLSEPNGEFANSIRTMTNKIFPVFSTKPKPVGFFKRLFLKEA